MSKELPYFRVTVQEWQNGNIMLLSDSCQGVFFQACCFYWANNCDLSEEMLLKKFKTKAKTIQKLIKSKVIKCQNGIISISFLDEQLSELNRKKSFYSEMGKLGQKAKKKKAPLKPPLSASLSNKDKDKDNTNGEKKNKTVYLANLHKFRKNPPDGWIAGLIEEYPRLDVPATLKVIYDYWCTDEAFARKKKTKAEKIDWKSTFKNGINMEFNQVYK